MLGTYFLLKSNYQISDYVSQKKFVLCRWIQLYKLHFQSSILNTITQSIDRTLRPSKTGLRPDPESSFSRDFLIFMCAHKCIHREDRMQEKLIQKTSKIDQLFPIQVYISSSFYISFQFEFLFALETYFFISIKLFQCNLCCFLTYVLIVHIHTENSIHSGFLKQSKILSSHVIIQKDVFRLHKKTNSLLSLRRYQLRSAAQSVSLMVLISFKIHRKKEIP